MDINIIGHADQQAHDNFGCSIGEVYRGEIYFANLDSSIGSEERGYRPVLILQNDAGNKRSQTTIVAAITSKTRKSQLPTHVFLRRNTAGLYRNSIIQMEQIRTLDKSRLVSRLGKVDDGVMLRAEQALAISLGLRIPS